MSGIELDAVIDLIAERIAERVAAKVGDRLGERPNIGPELINMRDFASRNSISETTVRAMIKDGRLDAVKIGTAVRIRADAQIGKSASRALAVAHTPQARAAGILRRIPESRGARPASKAGRLGCVGRLKRGADELVYTAELRRNVESATAPSLLGPVQPLTPKKDKVQ